MIRKLKILLHCKDRELATCDSRSRERIRLEKKALEMALRIAQERLKMQREARAA